MSQDGQYDVVPAHLEFLSIYSPDLPEESQLAFHYARPQRRRRRASASPAERAQQALQNEEEQQEAHRSMRQIGLAQGMVNFARSFSGKKDVDSIDSERHRTVLKELEKGWWILASIRLTRLRSSAGSSSKSKQSDPLDDFSARELSPSTVLIEQLLRAYRIFLLHQSHSLSDLYVRLSAQKFSHVLQGYWTEFAESWDVMLHGNPAADAFGGTRISAAGQLGVGVGEEEHGSAEREYLEELARSTDGLVDLVVSRHASLKASGQGQDAQSQTRPAELADGVVFSGNGALGSSSLRALSEWIALVAAHGTDAYGITNNPVSSRRNARRQGSSNTSGQANARSNAPPSKDTRSRKTSQAAPLRPSIPPPLISTSETTSTSQSFEARVDESAGRKGESHKAPNEAVEPNEQGVSWMNYLTLGYGTSWGSSGQRHASKGISATDDELLEGGPGHKHDDLGGGRFLVGLTGPITPSRSAEGVLREKDAEGVLHEEENDADLGSRLSIRTVNVEIWENADTRKINEHTAESSLLEQKVAQSETDGSLVLVKRRLRLILYQNIPFIYAFLFDTEASSLSIPSFYRDLHERLQLLCKALSVSTCPDRVHDRIQAALPQVGGADSDTTPIFDLVYDSSNLTVRTSIPNLPSFQGEESGEKPASTTRWSRLEALNMYTHMIALFAETRDSAATCERSVKTSRNWWVTWMRLLTAPRTDSQRLALASEADGPLEPRVCDVILVRRASDHKARGRESPSTSSAFGRLSLGGGSRGLSRLIGYESSNGGNTSDASQGSTGSARVAEDIGVDARQYVEALLKLDR